MTWSIESGGYGGIRESNLASKFHRPEICVGADGAPDFLAYLTSSIDVGVGSREYLHRFGGAPRGGARRTAHNIGFENIITLESSATNSRQPTKIFSDMSTVGDRKARTSFL